MATQAQVAHYEGLAAQAKAVFSVDGECYSLYDILRTNQDDADLCEWACSASVGDRFPAFVACQRVS